VTCDLSADGKTIVCTITAIPPTGGSAAKAKLTGSIRVAGTKKTTTRSGNGKVTMKLKSSKRLKKAPKVIIKVKSGNSKTVSKTVTAK
jgi:hypothetical protein